MSLLAELTARIEKLPPSARAEMARLASAELAKPFIPNPGPQTDALLSKADELLYGGAAGAGKSFLSIGMAAGYHERSLILRRHAVELDGLLEDSRIMLSDRPGWRHNGQPPETWRNDAEKRVITYGGMQQADDWRKYAGSPRDLMVFDEAAEFLEEQVASLIAWNRSANGHRCRVLLPSNPPRSSDGEWIREWFAPWLDPTFPSPAKAGELRFYIRVEGKTRWVDGPGVHEIDGQTYTARSRTFIPGRVQDNPYLSGTNYVATLQALPEPLRSQLLHGSFTAGQSDQERQVIPTEWIDAAMARWSPDAVRQTPMRALGVDVAQGGADNTILAPLHGTTFGELVVRPGTVTRNGPDVVSLVIQVRRGRAVIVIDCTGGWGGSARDILTEQGIDSEAFVASAGTDLRTKGGGELGFWNLRAAAWWRFREALDPDSGENIALPPDPALRAELAMPTWQAKNAKILVEAKDDIRKRLGRSTDRADAVIMAWMSRDAVITDVEKITFERRKGII